MARSKSSFVCQSCGTVHVRWAGQCDGCGEWNTVVEEIVDAPPVGGKASGKGDSAKSRAGRIAFVPLTGASERAPRLATDIGEFDRVLGGGLVEGSAT